MDEKPKIAVFDFDDDLYLVAYYSEKDIGFEIGEAIQSYVEDNDITSYTKEIDDVMAKFGVEYEIAKPENTYRI